jgi:hypothetical protein
MNTNQQVEVIQKELDYIVENYGEYNKRIQEILHEKYESEKDYVEGMKKKIESEEEKHIRLMEKLEERKKTHEFISDNSYKNVDPLYNQLQNLKYNNRMIERKLGYYVIYGREEIYVEKKNKGISEEELEEYGNEIKNIIGKSKELLIDAMKELRNKRKHLKIELLDNLKVLQQKQYEFIYSLLKEHLYEKEDNIFSYRYGNLRKISLKQLKRVETTIESKLKKLK